MLDHVAISTSLSARTQQLIAEGATWRAWAVRTQAEMQHTIGASERMLRDDRLRQAGTDRLGPARVPEHR